MGDQVDLERTWAELTAGDDNIAEAAVYRLAEFGSAIIPRLAKLCADPDPGLRWWAVRTLAEIDDQSSKMLLRRALVDPDPGVCQCAALALRQQPYPPAVPDLIEKLADIDRLLAYLAGEALIAIGQEAVPALLEVVQMGSAAARLEATRVLAKIADPRSIPVLFELSEGHSALMEYWADQGLERMGVGMVFYKPG
jgi:HEAT repeat protein